MNLNSRIDRIDKVFTESQGDEMNNIVVIIPMEMDEPPTPGQFMSCPHRDCFNHCGDKVKCALPDNNYKFNGKMLFVSLPKKLPKGWMKNEKP
jgi:hypothetical protein